MKKTCTVMTVQGIGDIFWVYQKLAPHFDEINIEIMVTNDLDVVQVRGKPFCELLPKAGTVKAVLVSHEKYAEIASARFNLKNILDKGVQKFFYAVNKPLEIGIRIEDIDPDVELERTVSLKGVPDSVEKGDYLCAYVSGNKWDKSWSDKKWAANIALMANALKLNTIKMTGAQYDAASQEKIAFALSDLGYNIQLTAGRLDLVDSIDLIRRSRFFFGYQSGLNILADNYDVPQAMVYFDFLRPMMNTWIKPGTFGVTHFAQCFGDDFTPFVEKIAQTRS